MTADPLFIFVARTGLAILFAAAAVHKFRDLPRFAAVLEAYRLLPRALVQPVAVALVAVEAALAVGLLVTAAALHGAALLLLGYGLVIAWSILSGNDRIDCGCLGFGAAVPQLRWAMVGRNLLLAGLAVAAASVVAASRGLIWLDWISLAAALAIAAGLYVSFERMIALPSRRTMA